MASSTVAILTKADRHWSVFYAGVIMMVIFWAITPLQSGIFATVPQTISTLVTALEAYPLIPAKDQASKLNAEFMSSAYGIIWLDGQLPDFTTREYALEAFSIDTDSMNLNRNDTWNLPTTSYSTELTCTVAQVSRGIGQSYFYSNGQGCNVTGIGFETPQPGHQLLAYVGYQDGPQTDYSLTQSGNCSKNNNFHAFLAVAAPEGIGLSGTIEVLHPTALFCETHYYTQSVNASISSSNLSVIASLPTGPRKILSDEQFNSSHFEYFLNVGANPSMDLSDWPNTDQIDLYPQLNDTRLDWPINPMVGFAMGLSGASMDRFLEPEVLHHAFEDVHKLMFALAIHQLRGPASKTSKVIVGTQETSLKTIVVIRTFAIVVEALLVVVALGASTLLFLYWNRQSNLTKDPASLADMLAIAPSTETTQDTFRRLEGFDTRALEQTLAGRHYAISIRNSGDGSTIEAISTAEVPQAATGGLADGGGNKKEIIDMNSTVLPYELSWYFGGAFIMTVLASIVLVATLNMRIQTSNGKLYTRRRGCCKALNPFRSLIVPGFAIPSSNVIVQQIVLNYIPTAFATFLGPVWVLLNRLLCILQPFEELRHEDKESSASLDLKYTSLPPPLIVWRALRARHLTLSCVCIVALLVNPLAIALKGLFEINIVMTDQVREMNARFIPKFDGMMWDLVIGHTHSNILSDHLYVQRANMSNNASLPHWVAPDFYFLPHAFAALYESETIFESPTKGFGISIDCHELEQEDATNDIDFAMLSDGRVLNVTSFHSLPHGEIATCVPDRGQGDGVAPYDGLIGLAIPDSPGPYSTSIVSAMIAMYNHTTTSEERELCEAQMVLGWLHANIVPSTHNQTLLVAEDLDIRLMVCRSSFRAADFLVNTTSTGHVLSYAQSTPFDTNTDKYFGAIQVGRLLSTANYATNRLHGGIQGWNNNTFAAEWVNYLLKISMNSSALLDPSTPLPPYSSIVPAVQSLNRSLFAILLSLHPELFPRAELSTPAALGKLYTLQARVFMSKTMFIVALTILTLNLAVAVLYYACRPKRFLPRMPTSIASVLAYVAASHLLKDIKSGKESLGRSRYRYGKFVGTDGKPHIGIEKAELVVPLETKRSLRRRRGLLSR